MSSLGTPSELSCNERFSICSLDDSINSKIYAYRHKYFDFKDGNVTFLVENTLFTIHQYFLERDSSTMRSMFARAHLSGIVRGTKENPIKLCGVTSLGFERFLKILYPPKFGEDSLTCSYEWESALRIADQYEFANIRKLAILKLLADAPCSERLDIGQRYNVRLLVLTGFRDICNREASLKLEEVQLLNAEDITLIMRCREDLLKSGRSSRASMSDHATELYFASRLPPIEPEESPPVPAPSGWGSDSN
ncbi:hypothetical protein DFH11DRAFT_1802646 [Phellopilus nigrolimitatus]|nr:hypothetical protein DFH11DRAFT_1802646 [Phellopilus nigrolimitatus]